MKAVKFVYGNDTTSKYVEVDLSDEEIFKECTLLNFNDSFGQFLADKEKKVDTSNQIKAVEIDGKLHEFRYNAKQEFYVHF